MIKKFPPHIAFDPLVKFNDAGALLGGVHPDTLEAWVVQGRLPPPLTLSPRVRGWRRSVLERVLAEAEGGAR